MTRVPSTAVRVVRAESLEMRQLLAGGPDVLVNNNPNAGAAANFTQSETSLLAFDNTVLVGFNDSGSNVGASKFTGFARSTNGGASFTDGETLPTTAGGDAGDPSMARDDTTGRIYFATLGFTTTTIRVFRSDDNGLTWLGPSIGTPGGSSEDKEWLAVDNFAGANRGNVYLMSRRFAGTTGLYFHRSTDQGVTFSTGLQLATGAVGPQGAYVTVGPDHTVYAFWFQANTIMLRRSTDGGLSFGAATTVASGIGGGTNGDLALTGLRQGLGTFSAFRSNAFPHVAVNRVNGNLYVTYNNNPAGTDKGDVQLVQSTDGGTTWSLPVRVNDDATATDQWQPTLAITPDGTKLGVFYYSRQEDSGANNLFKYYGRIATLSGATTTFAPSEAISDVASMPEFGRDSIVNPVYMGDYNMAAATNDAFHVVWSDNRDNHPLGSGAPRKDPNVYYDKIPLAVAPTVTTSSFGFATLPQKLTFRFDQNVSASLGLDDLLVQDLTHGGTIAPSGLSYDLGTNTATVTFAGVLPDARFRATLLAAGVTNAGGIPLAADHVLNFLFLLGDADNNGRVNLDDFNILAANFGQSPRDYTQGDFDYSGNVNLDDFNVLAGRFGTVLAGPSGTASALRGSGTKISTRELLDELLA